MSYDLTIYCADSSATIERVALLVGNTRGLHVDPKNSNERGMLVLRGVKRSYSFTVDGPFPLRAEDVPDVISVVLPDAVAMFQHRTGEMMTAGRWGLLVVAEVLMIVSVVLAVQGSTGLWFTATAMGILIFATLRARLKENRRSPDSNR